MVFVLLPLTVYFAFIPWSVSERRPDGDEPYYLLLTHSLAFDLDADLTDNYQRQDWLAFTDREMEPQPGDPVGPDGELYSRHNLTLPLLLAPAYRLAGRTGAVATMALLAALLCWSTLRLARHPFADRPGQALVAYGALALLAPTTLYATQIWVEVPAALLTTLAIDQALSLANRSGRRSIAGIVAAAAGLVLLKLRFTLLAVPVMALAAWRAPRARRWLGLGGIALAGALAVVLAFNQLVFGHPLKIYRWRELLELYRQPPVDYLMGILGLGFDCAFGLLFVAPLWAALLIPVSRNHGGRRDWATVAAAVFALYFVVLAPRTSWFGGFSPPFRYGYVILPALAIGLIPVLTRRHRPLVRTVLTTLLAATVVLTVCWITVPGWTYNLAHGRTYLLDHLTMKLGRDAARFFPSMVRPNLATWLWPAAVVALLAATRWPRRRGRRSAAPIWGVTCGLLGLAALAAAAASAPSQRTELEDPIVFLVQRAALPAAVATATCSVPGWAAAGRRRARRGAGERRRRGRSGSDWTSTS